MLPPEFPSQVMTKWSKNLATVLTVVTDVITIVSLIVTPSQTATNNQKNPFRCVKPSSEGTEGFRKFVQGQFNESIYTLVTEPKLTWKDAQTTCDLNCQDLASVQGTEEEFHFFKFLTTKAGISNLTSCDEIWVGGIRMNGGSISTRIRHSEQDFVWIETGELIPKSFWREGEPNNLLGQENCAHLKNFRGNDAYCLGKSDFLCKSKPKPTPPPSPMCSDGHFICGNSCCYKGWSCCGGEGCCYIGYKCCDNDGGCCRQ